MRPRLVWAGLVAAGTAVEIYGLRGHDDWCASTQLRRTLRTDHPVGRLALPVGWAMIGHWLIPHLTDAVEAAADALDPTT